MQAQVMLPASPLQPWSIGTSISKRRVPLFGSWDLTASRNWLLSAEILCKPRGWMVSHRNLNPKLKSHCLSTPSVLRSELPSLQEEAKVLGLQRAPENK